MQGEEEYEVVPDSQFVVSRTAHANNTNHYYLGERRSSYKEVVDLLKSKGIDLDNNRFLILQVSQLVSCALHSQAGCCACAARRLSVLPASEPATACCPTG